MQARLPLSREQIPGILVTALFVLFVVMLPRYTDTAKIWYALLILGALLYMLANNRQLQKTSTLERAWFAVIVAEFAWIAFTYYFNGEPGRGHSFVWSRHFYMLFLIPTFFLLRKVKISDRAIVVTLFCSVLLTFSDMAIDLLQGIDHREQGMNPNALGPIQLNLSGILFFYALKLPRSLLKGVAMAGCVLGVVTVVLSLSRATWITFIVVGLFFTFYLMPAQPRWKKWVTAVTILTLFSASYLIPLVKNRVDEISESVALYFARSDNHSSGIVTLGTFGVRAELWKTGWYIFLENPLTGAGVGGFQEMAKANSERYQVNEVVQRFKYAHNQYIVALATRGIPGLILFLLFLAIPIYIAMSHSSFERESEIARLSLLFICLNYSIGCLGEDHFEGKSAIMFVSVFLALMLARINTVESSPPPADPS